MPRTKNTARKSTGGTAPTRTDAQPVAQLVTKALGSAPTTRAAETVKRPQITAAPRNDKVRLFA
jgi:hypothetical protein